MLRDGNHGSWLYQFAYTALIRQSVLANRQIMRLVEIKLLQHELGQLTERQSEEWLRLNKAHDIERVP